MIDDPNKDGSEPGAWERFLAQRDGTPHTPLTDAELQRRKDDDDD